MKGKTDKELKLIVKKAIIAKRIVRKKLDLINKERWDYSDGKKRLEMLIKESRTVLGRKKAKGCPAIKKIQNKWSFGSNKTVYKCSARDSINQWIGGYDGKQLLYSYCHCCRLKPDQARVRVMMNKLRGKGNG